MLRIVTRCSQRSWQLSAQRPSVLSSLSFSSEPENHGSKPRIKLKQFESKPYRKDDDGDEKDDDDGHKREYPKPSPVSSHAAHKQEMEKNQQRAVMATKLGAVANISLAISKGLVGFSISSTALIADAANSLGDVLSDAVVFYTLHEARKTATPESPWGRGKVEPLGMSLSRVGGVHGSVITKATLCYVFRCSVGGRVTAGHWCWHRLLSIPRCI